MAKHLVISAEAKSELEDIWDYIALDRPIKADQFIDQLYLKCCDISNFNGIGCRGEELSKGLLSIPHKKYIIFFERSKNEISIVRIRRGSTI